MANHWVRAGGRADVELVHGDKREERWLCVADAR